MPQYQQLKKGQARIKILPKDASRAYLLLMQKTMGGLQVLPNDIYIIDDSLVSELDKIGLAFERVEDR